MAQPSIKTASTAPAAMSATTAALSSPTKKKNIFSHVKYEHMIAGISGGVTSTLILHPLDLIKIRFAGELHESYIM